ncbi:unannotated protein [freshwater metagenome]|uniref:Unannotated protein n=1 Tax=freshwater metagenome TaxID=449393 RepID=A0A6J7UUF2_9ZZZZ
MSIRKDHHLVQFLHTLASQRVNHRDRLNLIPKQRNAHCSFFIGRVDFNDVAAHPELASHQVHIVALVLQIDETPKHLSLVNCFAHPGGKQSFGVFLGRAETVDTRHRGHDNGVPASQECRSSGMTQTIDLIVDRGVLLDEGIAGRHVGLGLVIVVIRDEVFDAILWEELTELVG